jgi:hypothetical protein
MHTLSVHENDFIPWTGQYFAAKEILWTDVSKNIQLHRSPKEWILVSKDREGGYFWQEILRGSYAPFYAIICHPLADNRIRLTSTSSILCSQDPVLKNANFSDVGHVIVFSLTKSAVSMVEHIKEQEWLA